ncbi:MAG TPA: thiamine pyrophosphate-dependent dehydrogenase E1 component subunit alpha [Kofleriaceae bacterium]|nr:thiamine pyrophosphate-dependent dehydrogenase E1 component subunit alpha [Kofleriaceae bacterium]
MLDDDGKPLPGARVPSIPDATLARMFELMMLTRMLDDRAVQLSRQGRIGSYMASIGEEASQLAVAPLTAADWVFPSYRDPGAWLWRGCAIQALVDQLFGNAGDPSKGRQVPGHHAARALNLVSISSPVGTQLPQAAGAAYAARMQGRDDVTMALFGEAATSTGEFHVGVNFAAVWKAPCVFVCRHSGWTGGAPSAVQTAARTYAAKASGYGIPGVRVDGNDALAVWQVASEAIARARAGEGPTLIEALTYRPVPPPGTDAPPAAEVLALRGSHAQKDPLHRLRGYLRHAELWSERWEAELAERHDREIASAVATAEGKLRPALETLFDDVYDHLPWHLREQRAYLQAQPRVEPEPGENLRQT